MPAKTPMGDSGAAAGQNRIGARYADGRQRGPDGMETGGGSLGSAADLAGEAAVAVLLLGLLVAGPTRLVLVAGALVVGQGADGVDHAVPLGVDPPQVAAHLVAAGHMSQQVSWRISPNADMFQLGCA